MKKLIILLGLIYGQTWAQGIAIGGKSYTCSGNLVINNHVATCDGKPMSDDGKATSPCGNKVKLKTYTNPDGSKGGVYNEDTIITSPKTVFLSSNSVICGKFNISGKVKINDTVLNGSGKINGKGKRGVVVKDSVINDDINIDGDGIEISDAVVNDKLKMCDSTMLVGGVINDTASLSDFAKIVDGIINAPVTLKGNASIVDKVINEEVKK